MRELEVETLGFKIERTVIEHDIQTVRLVGDADSRVPEEGVKFVTRCAREDTDGGILRQFDCRCVEAENAQYECE